MWAFPVLAGGPQQPPLPGRDYYNVVKVQQPNIKLYCVLQLLFPMWYNGHTFNLAQEIYRFLGLQFGGAKWYHKCWVVGSPDQCNKGAGDRAT